MSDNVSNFEPVVDAAPSQLGGIPSLQRITITLGDALWQFDESRPLGPRGGFGQVFLGWSKDGREVAVKRLHVSAESAAHRELKIADDLVTGKFDHVMAVLDAGRDIASGAYFIIMEKAETSLQSQIESNGIFPTREAAAIMLQIARGLREVNHIVHRDLKPGNVLRHDGSWKIADFGIARFVADATATDTLKHCLSPNYAAPEQWLYERATGAADVYALGCIGFALLTGCEPFSGSGYDDLRDKHLNSDVPSLPATVAPQLRTLLASMLRKAPASRPTLDKICEVLTEIQNGAKEVGFGAAALAQAAARVEAVHAVRDRQESSVSLQRQERERLARTGQSVLDALVEDLAGEIKIAAFNASFSSGGQVSLGSGALRLPKRPLKVLPEGMFSESGWDVVLGDAISVTREPISSKGPRDEGYTVSSSLWYCKLPGSQQYRWYEINYWAPMRDNAFAPYAMTDNIKDADLASSNVMHIYAVSWGPHPIDDEDATEFKERWLAMFAKAVDGSLVSPRSMPFRREFWKDGQF